MTNKLSDFLKEVQTKNQKLQAEIEVKKKELLEYNKSQFPLIISELFSAYPELDEMRWKQYTPYFADGDECVFSANVEDVELNGYSEYNEDENDGNTRLDIRKNSKKTTWGTIRDKDLELNMAYPRREWIHGRNVETPYKVGDEGSIYNDNYSPYCEEILKNVIAFLRSIGDDDLKNIFGDHTEVIVTKNSVTTEEYQHD